MKKAVSLCEQVSHKDALALISWMNNKHVTGYLNEDENIVSELEYLLKHIHKAMLRYLFNRHGRFFFVRTEDNEPTSFIKLKEKGKGHYEVIYVIGHEELWGKGL